MSLQLEASKRKANKSEKQPVNENEVGAKATTKRTQAPGTVKVKENLITTSTYTEQEEQESSSTRIRRTMPKVTRRRCTESVLTTRNLYTEKGFVKEKRSNNEGKKPASSRNIIALKKGKPQRTKKVAKRKSTSKQKEGETESEDEASSEGYFSDISSGETDDVDRKKGKDDLNYDTAEVWKRNKRDVLKRRNLQGFGNLKTIGRQLTTKEMFTHKDNTKMRYVVSKPVKHTKKPGHAQMVALTENKVGFDYLQQITFLIDQLPNHLPIVKPKILQATYNYVNPKGVKQKGQDIPTNPYRTHCAYTLLIPFRTMDVVIDSSHLTTSEQKKIDIIGNSRKMRFAYRERCSILVAGKYDKESVTMGGC